MKKALVLVAILLLTSSLAWAQGTPGAAAPEAVGEADSGAAGGGCALPDFAGLSLDQRVAAALAAGFQTSGSVNAQTPACPEVSSFRCNTVTNCVVDSHCSFQTIGPCCDLGEGEIFCCARGNITLKQCLCQCPTSPCFLQCIDNAETTITCR